MTPELTPPAIPGEVIGGGLVGFIFAIVWAITKLWPMFVDGKRTGRQETISELYKLVDKLQKRADNLERKLEESQREAEAKIEEVREAAESKIAVVIQADLRCQRRMNRAEAHIEILQDALRRANIPFREWKLDQTEEG